MEGCSVCAVVGDKTSGHEDELRFAVDRGGVFPFDVALAADRPAAPAEDFERVDVNERVD